jgi:hypothetical protein
MGLKLMKYHAIMHMSQDIANFGVPMNYDTGSGESGHKASKIAAKLTQKRKDTFDSQIQKRLSEVHCLDLAVLEVDRSSPPWKYYEPLVVTPGQTEVPPATRRVYLSGSEFSVVHDGRNDQFCEIGRKRLDRPEISLERPFADFVNKLSSKISPYMKESKISVKTTCTIDGSIFRSSPCFSGSVWRDWVLIDWGENGGKLPAKIWGFVDLRRLRRQSIDINVGGQKKLSRCIYAIVESAESLKDTATSDLLLAFKKMARMREGRVADFLFYLVDVDWFDEPVAVVPDVGGAANGYFMLKRRELWVESFTEWLNLPMEQFPDFEEWDGENANLEEDDDDDADYLVSDSSLGSEEDSALSDDLGDLSVDDQPQETDNDSFGDSSIDSS